MENIEPMKATFTSKRKQAAGKALPALAGLVICLGLSSCGGNSTSKTAIVAATPDPQIFLASAVWGTDVNNITNTVAVYALDEEAKTFTQTTYGFSASQENAQVNYAGNLTPLARGLIGLDLTYNVDSGGSTCSGNFCPLSYSPAIPYGWALELADQSGGFVQLENQAVTPLVAASACPDSKATTYQFVTIPAPVAPTGELQAPPVWYPLADTAYGSVSVTGTGANVSFSGIKQYALGGAAPLQTYSTLSGTPAVYTSIAGTCYATVYGNTISVPASTTILNPGSDEAVEPTAITGIGASGLLVESNTSNFTAKSSPPYQPFLGAGTGAIGLPQPSSAITASSLTGARYLGFVYGSGNVSANPTWSSTVASFGFSTVPTSCASIAPASSTLIYGGDFPANNPGSSAVQGNGGFGNCDLAIDLGAQASATNGLFPHATVYIGASFSANPTVGAFSFPAVAIAGQLDGKNAIFLIGDQTSNTGTPIQGWGIYLLQSN